jgi:hypothetical protein
MRAGRPRKFGERYPSGQLKRPNAVQQIAEAERTRADQEKIVVLAQPHRRGEQSQLAGSALGRFILKHKMRSECYDAAEQWAIVKRKWLSAMGARLPEKIHGTGADIPMELVNSWRDQDYDAQQAMLRYGGPDGLLSVTWMAFDNFDFAPGADPVLAQRALLALAVFMGQISPQALAAFEPLARRSQVVPN